MRVADGAIDGVVHVFVYEERIVDNAVAAEGVGDGQCVDSITCIGMSDKEVWQLVLDNGVGNSGVGGWYYVDGHREDAVGAGMCSKGVGLCGVER